MSGTTIATLVTIGIMLFFVIFGLVRGFVKSFFKVFGVIFAIMLAFALSGLTVKFLENVFGLQTTIAEGLRETLNNVLGESIVNSRVSDVNENMIFISWIRDMIISAKTSTPDLTVFEVIAPTVANYILIVLSAILLYILFRILFFIIVKIITKKKDNKNKAFSLLDKIFGAVFGLVESLFIIDLIIIIIDTVLFIFWPNLSTTIHASQFINFISSFNVFNLFIEAINKLSTILSTLTAQA